MDHSPQTHIGRIYEQIRKSLRNIFYAKRFVDLHVTNENPDQIILDVENV